MMNISNHTMMSSVRSLASNAQELQQIKQAEISGTGSSKHVALQSTSDSTDIKADAQTSVPISTEPLSTSGLSNTSALQATGVIASLDLPQFNLVSGALSAAGLQNVTVDSTRSPADKFQGTGSNLSDVGGTKQTRSVEPETLAQQVVTDDSATTSGIDEEHEHSETQHAEESQSTQQGAEQSKVKPDVSNTSELAELEQLKELQARDTEVRTHEQAHASVGGQYAQSPNFEYEKGSDGQRYAVNGEVQIDVSEVAGDPEATITKMKQVYAAAMAPVNPSMADIQVAAQAMQSMNSAKQEVTENRIEQTSDSQRSEEVGTNIQRDTDLADVENAYKADNKDDTTVPMTETSTSSVVIPTATLAQTYNQPQEDSSLYSSSGISIVA